MSNTIKLTFLSILLTVIVTIFLFTRNSFHAKIYNKTGHDIDSLVIGKTFIGHLANNDSTDYINFKKFQFDGSIPYEKLQGIIQKKNLSQFNWSWCGTSRNSKSNGSYQFDIRTVQQNDSIGLYLVKHEEKIFNFGVK
jgi:hypothetical protein